MNMQREKPEMSSGALPSRLVTKKGPLRQGDSGITPTQAAEKQERKKKIARLSPTPTNKAESFSLPTRSRIARRQIDESCAIKN
jgi:hypothetical protein